MKELQRKFRSKYSGQEIEDLLNQVKNKLDSTIIIQDIKQGSDDTVHSSNVTKQLNEKINNITDPLYLKKIFDSIGGFNIFGDEEKEKLERLNPLFQGVYLTLDEANRSLEEKIETFYGGELILVLNIGSNVSGFYVWNITFGRWDYVNLLKEEDNKKKLVSKDDIVMLGKINLNEHNSTKIMVTISRNSDIQSFDLTVTKMEGGNVFYTVSNYISNLNVSTPQHVTIIADDTSTPDTVFINLKANVDITIGFKTLAKV